MVQHTMTRVADLGAQSLGKGAARKAKASVLALVAHGRITLTHTAAASGWIWAADQETSSTVG
jgi:hypothetical protein